MKSLCAATVALVLCASAGAQDPLFTIVQISDSQPKTTDDQLRFELVLDTIVAAGRGGALLPHPIDVVFFAGDLVDGDNESEWITWVQTVDTRLTAGGIAYHAVPGNHDQEGGNVIFYEQYVADAGVWDVGSAGSTGHNGIAWATGWDGLRFIGFNNSNGGANDIDPADIIQIDTLVAAAAVDGENVVLVAHHRHNEGSGIILTTALETACTVGYMHGHAGPPEASAGLNGVSNPNVWKLSSNSIINDGAILYYEAFTDHLDVYVIEMAGNPGGLPAPATLPLVHDLTPANPVTPVAAFSGMPLIGAAPLEVSFTDLSSGGPTMWTWTFGDGNGSPDQHPSHTYVTPGSYDVTLSVSNTQGNDSITVVDYVTVEESTTTVLLPVADARVKSTSPDSNYGTDDHLRCRDGMGSQSTYESYLQFDLTGVASTSVSSAVLRLYVTDGSDDGGTVFGVDSNWTETGITYATAPPIGLTPLGSNGEVFDDTWVELDVSAYVRTTSVYSFGLRNYDSNSVYFSSREGVNSPELVVEADELCVGVMCPPGEACAGGVCEVLCGNGVVNLGEDCANCPQDVICGIDEECVAGVCEPLCGNGAVDPGEDCETCPADVPCAVDEACVAGTCEPLCGNGAVDPGEDCANCPQDVICPPGDECVGGMCERLCGNGVTDPGEDCANCPQDVTCAPDEACIAGVCEPLCGNGVPDPGEDCTNCPNDVTCPPGEECVAGVCEPLCGNGVPDPGEDCTSCRDDVTCQAGEQCVAGVCQPLCWWDVTGDDVVGIDDFLQLLAAWGGNPGAPPDFDGNGDVDLADMLSLLAAWGSCLP